MNDVVRSLYIRDRNDVLYLYGIISYLKSYLCCVTSNLNNHHAMYTARLSLDTCVCFDFSNAVKQSHKPDYTWLMRLKGIYLEPHSHIVLHVV